MIQQLDLFGSPEPQPVKEKAQPQVKEQEVRQQDGEHIEQQPAAVQPGTVAVSITVQRPAAPPPQPEPAAAKPKKRGRKSLKDTADDPQIIQEIDKLKLDKLYYPISEVANMFRVNTSLIRYWENEFDILQPKKNRKGDRLFRPEDIQNLKLIYHLLRERKYTIEGAKQKLRDDRKTAARNFEMVQSLLKVKGFLSELKDQL
ncbi:MerR family transcriptional regulator [Chitinophaga sedimenti]|uniref:MerR family transcriptional regulator n=1 Tax=Chitinophaga sedimenti TaxID=2033606 RepID=UPI0020062287|nr:MerR family transcriptional regulator [Chitinophaga sedimenti]MCK7558945.1 MerR family transcriptional regulator [Chitinophaga sedimenti]